MSTVSYPTPSLASSLFALATSGSIGCAPHSVVSTSCQSIDDALLGGFPYGSVTSISGSTPSTRTLIAIHTFVAHLLSDPSTEATWIDTSGSFPVETLRELLQVRALDRAKVTRVFDLFGIVEAINEIKEEHQVRQRSIEGVRDSEGEEGEEEEEEERGGGSGVPYAQRMCGVRLVVVDNITQPYMAMVNRNQLQGQAMLVTIQRSLATLARNLGTVVLLLNDVLATFRNSKGTFRHAIMHGTFEDASLRFLSGPTYSYGVDLHVLLSRHPGRKGEEVGRHDNVLEVLTDRSGGRGGRWAPFVVVGTELVSWDGI